MFTLSEHLKLWAMYNISSVLHFGIDVDITLVSSLKIKSMLNKRFKLLCKTKYQIDLFQILLSKRLGYIMKAVTLHLHSVILYNVRERKDIG